MNRAPLIPRSPLLLALLLALAGPAVQAQNAAAPAAAAASAPTLRAEVAKPLQAAQEAIDQAGLLRSNK